MEKDKFEIDLLLEQRKMLISDTKELNSNMFKIIIAIIPIIATLVASYFTVINDVRAYIIRFIVLEMVFILSMIIGAFLFAANINRDYIAAIDEYLLDTYDVTVLFYGGELSREHTTGMKGVFPLTTGLIGLNATCAIMLMFIYVIKFDISFYASHIYLLVLFAVQALAYLVIICINFNRKITKRSIITEECINYMERAKSKK